MFESIPVAHLKRAVNLTQNSVNQALLLTNFAETFERFLGRDGEKGLALGYNRTVSGRGSGRSVSRNIFNNNTLYLVFSVVT